MKSLIKYFSSVKLAIFLLIIITLASVIGTLIPQQRTPEEYIAQYGRWANVFQQLQLTNLYKSWWFSALLFLFALNIIVCTLDRLSPKLKKAFRPRVAVETKTIEALKIKEKFTKSMSLDSSREMLKTEFSSRRFRVRETQKDNKAFIYARKRVLGWFGADIVHLGLLIIIAGGIISGIGGHRWSLTFSEGNTLDIPRAEFKLRLDKFETEYYPNGAVKDWKSTLTVLENEKPVLNKIVEVNHPLSYKGYVFYQSSYGWDWRNPSVEILAKKREDSSFSRTMTLKIGERAKLKGEEIEVSVLEFIPDFVIGEKGQIATRSLDPNNPAVFIEGWQEEEKIFSGWIFAKFPDFARIHSEKETDLTFELKDFKSSQLSIIQASKDPGANFIWAGCTFLMIGLLFAFYWPTREIRVAMEGVGNKTEITVGGIAAKSRDTFKSEFEKITQSIRRSK
jgi:cytochrome c biogenesis protein